MPFVLAVEHVSPLPGTASWTAQIFSGKGLSVFPGKPSPDDLIPWASHRGSTRLVIGGAVACGVALVLYAVSMHTHPEHMELNWFDFRVYWDGGQVARHSPGRLYAWRLGPEVRFTYTPFAAVLFSVLSLVPWTAARWLMTGASAAALLLTISMTLCQLGWQGRRRLGAVLLFGAVAFWFQPVQRAMHLGQIELILMALIVWDLSQPSRRWWRGAGIGLAAGIKLVPLVFIPYLLLTGRFRQAGVAIAVLAGTVIAGFGVLPKASRQWWLTGYFLGAGRTGGVASLANQSLRGLLARLAGSVPAAAPGSLVVAILVGVIGVLGAAVFYQSGRPVHGWALCALTGLLVSPISWDHHWVWMVPVLVLLADAAMLSERARRWALWAATGAVGVVFFDWPGSVPGDGSLVPRGVLPLVYGPGEHPYGDLYHWPGAELLLGNAYILAGLVLFGAMTGAAATRPSRAFPTPGGWLEDPFPLPRRSEADGELIRNLPAR
jgi:alpha-1,2-mannosyltransferase